VAADARGDTVSAQRGVPPLPSARYSHSFERGLALLKAFTPGKPVLGIADLADQLGMSGSTTHRYAITLVALGYLEQSASRKYRLAGRASDPGIVALKGTRSYERALPVLEDLRKQTGYTATLAVLDGTEIA
jgi:IclR family transcriptional regulator, pca regulon regulatory protein